MLDHADIWRAIDRLAESRRLSPSGLAKCAGLDPTAFNKSKRVTGDGKPRWPSTETVAKILDATGASFAEFVDLIGEDATGIGIHHIPLVDYDEAESEGLFDSQGRPIGERWNVVDVTFMDDPDAFALRIADDRMEPVYRDGDLIVLSPAADIGRGNRVVLKTESGAVLAKELVRRTAQRIEVTPFAPAGRHRMFPTDDIAWMTRIVWATQ